MPFLKSLRNCFPRSFLRASLCNVCKISWFLGSLVDSEGSKHVLVTSTKWACKSDCQVFQAFFHTKLFFVNKGIMRS